MEGYIGLARSIMNNGIHPVNTTRPWTSYEAWIDMIFLARWQEEPKVIFKGEHEKITINRGEMFTTQRQLADRWRWSVGKVNRFIKNLKKNKMIFENVNRHFTVITLVNYDKFNPLNERKMNGNGTENERKMNTYKESNNNNNIITPLTPQGEEDKKNLKDTAFQALVKWFKTMNDVTSPEALSGKYLDMYSPEAVLAALKNSACTSRSGFQKIASFKQEKLKKRL